MNNGVIKQELDKAIEQEIKEYTTKGNSFADACSQLKTHYKELIKQVAKCSSSDIKLVLRKVKYICKIADINFACAVRRDTSKKYYKEYFVPAAKQYNAALAIIVELKSNLPSILKTSSSDEIVELNNLEQNIISKMQNVESCFLVKIKGNYSPLIIN